jgi:hypothetical protein
VKTAGDRIVKRVFISFRAEDRQQVNGLRLLAANPDFEIEFYDESVRTPYDSTNEAYIRQKILEKINRTSITLCMVSEQTYSSTWVCWELEESIKKGNAIIVMGLPNGPGTILLPEPVRNRQWWLWNLQHLNQMIRAAP